MNFCTYFDSAYLTKAIVCRHTLMSQNIKLFVLCLDLNVESVVKTWPEAVIIRLSDIETYKPQLLSIKNKRLPKEYYATITPILPQYIFDRFGIDLLFYTDADMSFWSSVEEIKDIMGNNSLLVTPHENPAAFVAGYFNVGILGYRNDQNCREFLEWWEKQCLDWCEWRALSDGRCADQGYLSILHNQPNRFKGVLSCPHPGLNIAAWNIALHKTDEVNGKIILDNKYNLISYHFHGYKNISGKCVNDTGWEVSQWNMEYIYYPYHELILKAEKGNM